MPDATAAIALKATSSILNAISASPALAGPICETIRTVGCKDQIAFTNALNALGPAFANISTQYMKMLNEVVQVSLQSSCKNYELIVEAIVNDPTASLDEKVEHVSRLEKERAKNQNKLIKTVSGGVAALATIVGGVIVLPKISSDARGAYNDYQKTERTKAVLDAIVSIFRGRQNGGK